MIVEVMRSLYNYSNWANQRILETAAKMSSEQLAADGGAGHRSLHETLVHIMSSQWMWSKRWKGTSPPKVLDPGDFSDLVAIRSRWGEIERDTEEFLARLDSDQLGKVINYVTTEGEPRSYPLWQPMLQQINHATQHRSEAAVMLTDFGYSPGDLDFIIYLHRERKVS